MPLERQQDSLRDSFLPSIATEAVSSKETLHPSPCETCETCDCTPENILWMSRSLCITGLQGFPPQNRKQTPLSPLRLLCTQVSCFSLKTRTNFCIIHMIKVSMHFSFAMSVYTISAESQEL